MNSRYTIVRLLCLSVLVLGSTIWAKDESCALDIRVLPQSPDFFVCRATNVSKKKISMVDVSRMFMDRNSFDFVLLGDKRRLRTRLGGTDDPIDDPFAAPDRLELAPGKTWEKVIAKADESAWQFSFPGQYVVLSWYLGPFHSQTICVAFAGKDGKIATPVVDPKSSSAKLVLAHIFGEKDQSNLALVLLNGTNRAISSAVLKPSVIILEAPATKFKKEVKLTDLKLEISAVKAKAVSEWRLPWKMLLSTIPKKEMVKIIKADGHLNLHWRTDDAKSAVLPVKLSAPGKGE